MNSVHFDPWIGNDYWNGGCFDKKILVLGESHYGQDTGSSKTIDLLYDQACSHYTMAAYTNFERALNGCETDCDDRERIWNSVAFYNYVQSCVSKSRKSPKQCQFEESEDAFFEVLEYLEPDVVLVWGSRLWENLPYTNFESWSDCEYEGYSYRSGSYTTDSGLVIPCYEIQHPSSGFSWSWWHDFMECNGILPNPL